MAAPRVAIEADVLALRTLHGEPAPLTGASGASIGETIGHARWICATSTSAVGPQRIAGGNARQGAARVVVAAGVEGLTRVVQRDLGGAGVRGRGAAGRHAADDLEDPIARGDRVAGHEEQHAGGGDEQRVRHLRAPRGGGRPRVAAIGGIGLGRRLRRSQPGRERAADDEHAGIRDRSRLGRPGLVSPAAMHVGGGGRGGLGDALPLGDGAARPFDVGPGAGVGAIEEEDARPHLHRAVVAAGEVLVEPGREQLIDARRLIVRSGRRRRRRGGRRRRVVGHVGSRPAAIIGDFGRPAQGR